MHVTSLLLSALYVAASVYGSFTIPEDQPDGSYLVSVDEAGNTIHEKIESLSEATTGLKPRSNSAKFSPKPDIFARQSVTITCTGYYLNVADADAAVTDLANQCGSGGVMGGYRSFYSKRGNVVAYFCNNSSGSNTCYSWEVRDNLVGVGSSFCGSYAGFSVYLSGKQGTYGQLVVSASFC
ncbi:hypothetical protein B0O99DRAFT_692098 [Bisporella sp. PMI_857]|nr:hypothetical protein B0O99DRAFT_692098 [Bisporella sp. PMI_857]